MRVAIISDNAIEINSVVSLLKEINKSVIIEAVFSSGKDALRGIKQINSFDLLILDVQISDIRFNKILSILQITTPIIFLSEDIEDWEEFFPYNLIAIINKPVSRSQVALALSKYDRLLMHFSSLKPDNVYRGGMIKAIKNRFIARRGLDLLVVPQENIACFYTKNRIVFMITNDNQKYVTEYSRLTDIETEIDSRSFYKINRKFIINISALKKFRSYQKVKLLVELDVTVGEELIVSQGNATEFKEWIRQELKHLD